jgi:hypothetical protein
VFVISHSLPIAMFICRCDSREDLSYDDLKTRIMDLINHGSHVAVVTKKAIKDLTDSTLNRPNVWADLEEDIESNVPGDFHRRDR